MNDSTESPASTFELGGGLPLGENVSLVSYTEQSSIGIMNECARNESKLVTVV